MKESGNPEYHFKQLRHKTVGLIGFGNIAKALTKRLIGFECNIVAYDPYVSNDIMKSLGVKKMKFDELLKISDIVSLHLPLNDSTKGIIGEKEFAMMKYGSFIINTARGMLIQEDALVRALQKGRIAGAGLDVLCQEPVTPENPLLQMENVFITPHIAGTADESMVLTAKQATKNCIDALLGKQPDFVANTQAFHKWEERFVK